MRPSTVADHSARLSYSGASSPRVSRSAPAAVKAAFNTHVNIAPVFTSSATVNAAENQTAVLTVTATDAAGGVALTFSITGGLDSSKFSITSGGVLTFDSSPDYEIPTDSNTDNVYVVEVTTTDGIASTAQTISVTVTDVVENTAPVITSDGGGATAAINANENQTAVTTVTATDADGDTVTFSITGGADQAKFSINSSTGVLVFQSAPDFESPTDTGANNTYEVEVTATDDGAGTLTDVQTITVTVQDVNEAPVITSNAGGATASINVAENTTAVTTVTATDVDGDTVTFGIQGGAGTGNEDSALFSINTGTGVLVFSSAPDFETKLDHNTDNVYNVIVTATDDGAGALSDTQTLSVTVTDVADTATTHNGTIVISGSATATAS